MRAAALGPGGWHKPWSSTNGGACLDARNLPGGRVALRQSTDPGGPALILEPHEIQAFIQGAKSGAADYLLPCPAPLADPASRATPGHGTVPPDEAARPRAATGHGRPGEQAQTPANTAGVTAIGSRHPRLGCTECHRNSAHGYGRSGAPAAGTCHRWPGSSPERPATAGTRCPAKNACSSTSAARKAARAQPPNATNSSIARRSASNSPTSARTAAQTNPAHLPSHHQTCATRPRATGLQMPSPCTALLHASRPSHRGVIVTTRPAA